MAWKNFCKHDLLIGDLDALLSTPRALLFEADDVSGGCCGGCNRGRLHILCLHPPCVGDVVCKVPLFICSAIPQLKAGELALFMVEKSTTSDNGMPSSLGGRRDMKRVHLASGLLDESCANMRRVRSLV